MRSQRTRNRRRPLQICIGLLLGFILVSCHRPGTAELPERQKDDFLILTPKSPETPQIHGAKVFGVRPNSPFLFQIAATGKRPIEYSALNLPAGLQLDKSTGQITGVLRVGGSYPITENSLGADGAATAGHGR